MTPDASVPQPPTGAPQPYHSAPQPPWPPQYTPAPQPRRRTGLWVALGVALVLALVGGATALGLALRDNSRPAALAATASATSSPSPSASPSPSYAAVYDQATACRKSTLLMVDAVDLVDKFVKTPDGSTVPMPKLRATIQSLRETQPSLPAGLRSYVDDVVAPLDALLTSLTTRTNATIQLDRFRASSMALIMGCGPYASPR